MKDKSILKLKKIKGMLLVAIFTSSIFLTLFGTTEASADTLKLDNTDKASTSISTPSPTYAAPSTGRITPASEIKKRIDTAPGEVFIIQSGDTVEEFGKATGKTNREIADFNNLKLDGDERRLQIGTPFVRTLEEAKLIAEMPEDKRTPLSIKAANSLIEYEAIKKSKDVKSSSSVSSVIKNATKKAAAAAHKNTRKIFKRNGRSLKKVLRETMKAARKLNKKLKKNKVSAKKRKQLIPEVSGRIAAAATKIAITEKIAKEAAENVVKKTKQGKKPQVAAEGAEQPKEIQKAANSNFPNPEPNNADTPKPTEGEAELAAKAEVSLYSEESDEIALTDETTPEPAVTSVEKKNSNGVSIIPVDNNATTGTNHAKPFANGVANLRLMTSANDEAIVAIKADMQNKAASSASKGSVIRFNFNRNQFWSQMYLHVSKTVDGKQVIVKESRIISPGSSPFYQILVPDEWFEGAENGLEIKFYDQKTNKYYPEEDDKIYGLQLGDSLEIDATQEQAKPVTSQPTTEAASAEKSKKRSTVSFLYVGNLFSNRPWADRMYLEATYTIHGNNNIEEVVMDERNENNGRYDHWRVPNNLLDDADNNQIKVRFHNKDKSQYSPTNNKFFVLKKGEYIIYRVGQIDAGGEYVEVGVSNSEKIGEQIGTSHPGGKSYATY